MGSNIFHGVISNVFTTFNEDGTLDVAGQRNFLDALYSTGAVSTYFVRSGMGQMYVYGYDEVKTMATNACTHMRDRAPVIVGTSGIWNRDRDNKPDPDVYTRQAVELSRFAQDEGAAAVVLTMPEGLVLRNGESPLDASLRYFEAVSNAIDIPIMLYQPPGVDKSFCVTADSIKAIAQVPRIAGIKISTADAYYMLDICWATRDLDFCYVVGHEGGFYSGLGMGATGCIGQGACVNPAILKAVQVRFEKGDLRGAMDAQRSVNMLVQESRSAVEFLKRYFNEKGFAMKPYSRTADAGPYKAVKEGLTQEDYERFKRILEAELAKYPAAK